MKKHLIIDSTNLLYRAHFTSDLRYKGKRTSGIYNSIRMLDNLIREHRPTNVILAWDLGKSQARLQIYPEYKGQRDRYRKDTDKEEIAYQRTLLQEIQNLLPVKQVMVQDMEADDIIGYLCGKLKGKKIIVSNDTDFIQLVNETTSLWLPTKLKMIHVDNANSYLGYPLKHYVTWKCLVGDSSDNIKGVHGIGPAKATAIVKAMTKLKGDKKLPIKAEEMAIMKRNRMLITLGAILSEDDEAVIWKKYMQARKLASKPDFKSFKEHLKKLNLKQILAYYESIETRLRRLKRIQDEQATKTKIKKQKRS